MKIKTRKVREARDASKLPSRLKEMWLLGSFEDKLLLGSKVVEGKDTLFGDTLVYNYSLDEDKINNVFRIKEGEWPESWTQKDNILYLGTREGNVLAVNMKTGKTIGRIKLGNAIDCIAVDNDVYFGYNGEGICKSTRRLKGMSRVNKPNVASAMTFFNNKLYVFYHSNGKDPFLGDTDCGGLIEILDKEMGVLDKRDPTPYAVSHAFTNGDEIFFATEDTSNGWIEDGEGSLYRLNPESLEFKHITQLPAAVTSMFKNNNHILLGLKNGELLALDKEGRKKTLYSSSSCSTEAVKGIVIRDKKIYISQLGEIIELSN